MRDWLDTAVDGQGDIAVLGVPISKASISPSQAWATPGAFREELRRFFAWDASTGNDISLLRGIDLGDSRSDRDDADAGAAHEAIAVAMARARQVAPVTVLIGGDNSLTRPALQALMEIEAQSNWGLLTFDAHHDCRPVVTTSRNGTPVRELIEAGLPGTRVAQIGIQPFANARPYASWAGQQGVHLFPVEDVHRQGMEHVLEEALRTLRTHGADAIYADVDVDVLDRAFAPACPASLPGGLHPGQLLPAMRQLGREPDVAAVDFTEVDAHADIQNVTVRFVAAAFTYFCSGLTERGEEATLP